VSAGPATVVVIAEHKDPLPATVERGLSLFTVHVAELMCADAAGRTAP